MKCADIVVKTLKGMEEVAASRILELDAELQVEAKPQGYLGIVLVYGVSDKRRLAERIKREVLEAEKVLVVRECTQADLEKIAEAAAKASKNFILSEDTFAVRTTRRGKHSFTSIDVNVRAGEAVQKVTGADVNLDYPDKIVWVEIFGDVAYICLGEGVEEYRKKSPEKVDALRILKKMSLVQMPYLGPLDAAKEFGIRIGRCAQAFEVGELVVAPIGVVDARQLNSFLSGVFEGIESRYEIQRRSYARRPWRVPVFVQNLYELVRERRKEPIVVFEPEGREVFRLSEELRDLFRKHDRVNMLIGAREGIPSGIFRVADLVVDLCPGVTISTDFAASAAIIAVLTSLGGEV